MPDQNASIAHLLTAAIDALALQAEAAIGYRARLERMGWSPTKAEEIAAEVTMQLNRAALSPTPPTTGSPK